MQEGIFELSPAKLPITKISFEAQVGGVTVTVQLAGPPERMRSIQDEIGEALAISQQAFDVMDNPQPACASCEPGGQISSRAAEVEKAWEKANGHGDIGDVAEAFGAAPCRIV